MEKRIRLTSRTASKRFVADQKQPQTAIDLGKNRTYHKIDEYHTFKQNVNHELPDMRHEWKDNPRTETGHGIPKMAKVYMAAKKATKLAMMFLGEKANEEDIEKQARAFMRMGDKALTASINRWAECQGEDCCDEKETNASKEAEEDEVKAETAEKACKEVEAEKEETTATETACEADDESAEAPAVEIKAAESEAPAAVAEEAPAVEKVEQAEKVEDDEEADIEIPEDGGDDAIEFDEAETTETAADDDLTACFADDETVEEEVKAEKATVAHKVGVKKISGQPTLTRIAKKADELSGLWDKWENPDVR